MKEKSGFTGKLKFDFNESNCLEIYQDKWYRVTPSMFRSFNGKRRILNIKDINNAFYEEYTGDVYLYNTNIKYTGDLPGFIYPKGFDINTKNQRYGQRKGNSKIPK